MCLNGNKEEPKNSYRHLLWRLETSRVSTDPKESLLSANSRDEVQPILVSTFPSTFLVAGQRHHWLASLPVDKSGRNLVLFTFRNQKRRACWNELSLQQTTNGKSKDKASTHNACVKWRKCLSIDFVMGRSVHEGSISFSVSYSGRDALVAYIHRHFLSRSK